MFILWTSLQMQDEVTTSKVIEYKKDWMKMGVILWRSSKLKRYDVLITHSVDILGRYIKNM